jgi:hypothetical protein
MTGTAPPSPDWRRALVVFSGRTELTWLKWLRPGFRHCFLLLDGPQGWLCINPLAHHTHIQPLQLPAGFDLAGWYRRMGFRVIEAPVAVPRCRALPWRPFTCVEAVKRILGIRAGLILTPWQLYLFLSNSGKKSLTPGADAPNVDSSTPQPRPIPAAPSGPAAFLRRLWNKS